MSVNRKHLYLYKILARGKAPGGNVFKRKTGPAGRAALSVREAPTLRRFVPRSLSISLGIRKAIFDCAMGRVSV